MHANDADPRALHVLLVEDDPGDVLLAIITWIERTYHRRRRQRRLGKLTPVEYEVLYTQVALAA